MPLDAEDDKPLIPLGESNLELNLPLLHYHKNKGIFGIELKPTIYCFFHRRRYNISFKSLMNIRGNSSRYQFLFILSLDFIFHYFLNKRRWGMGLSERKKR